MYQSFYQLQQKPFQITTDPAFLWLGQKHREALATLKYGVMENKGFLLLTGDVGTGKTTLVNALVKTLDERVLTAMIADPGLSRFDFYRMVARAFGIAGEIRNKSDFLEGFSRFLYTAHADNRTVLLIIDETQRLKHDLLEEIRLLSNIEKTDAKLLNIFFVGQSEVNDLLLRSENRALRKRISITYNLEPLTLTETRSYIDHRLKTAGASRNLFSSRAIADVFDFSGGSPRQINIICDLALLYGFEASKKTINRGIVRQCREKVRFPQMVPAGDINPRRSADAPDPTNAVLRWAVGVIAIMVVVITAALFFPGRFGGGGLGVSQPRQRAASARALVVVPEADMPQERHRTTVTATLAEPAAPPPLDLREGAPVAAEGGTPDDTLGESVAVPSAGGDETEPAVDTDRRQAAVTGPTKPQSPTPTRHLDTAARVADVTALAGTGPDEPVAVHEPAPTDIIDWLMKKKTGPVEQRSDQGTP